VSKRDSYPAVLNCCPSVAKRVVLKAELVRHQASKVRILYDSMSDLHLVALISGLGFFIIKTWRCGIYCVLHNVFVYQYLSVGDIYETIKFRWLGIPWEAALLACECMCTIGVYKGVPHVPMNTLMSQKQQKFGVIHSVVHKFWTDFLKNRRHLKTHFLKFKIDSIGIYTGFCMVLQFLKSCQKVLFLGLL
jgi:hypothetical protein